MADALKNLYHKNFFTEMILGLKKIYPSFNEEKFFSEIFDQTWEAKELKQRMSHIASVLNNNLADSYQKNIKIILNLVLELQIKNNTELGFEYMFLPDFIEQFGMNDYEISMAAMEKITEFTSGEFAIRPFIQKYSQTMVQMKIWATHSHAMVRRLATEGCRPRLPWAMGLPEFKQDPTSILEILELLKNDESESVRRSVANNLNDISKDNPDLVILVLKRWQGINKNVDWVCRHGARTLLKSGNSEALQLFGFGNPDNFLLSNLEILTPTVCIGDSLKFSCVIKNKTDQLQKLRLEYGLHYLKANGKLARKVFQISEKKMKPFESRIIEKKQSFKIISTRRFYTGIHGLSIIINGQDSEMIQFELIN